MPLARIITRLVDEAHSLAEDLRARGFEVHTRSPQEMFSEPADLEITLEECATEDALERLTHSSATHDVCVFLAPGAISENLRPIQVVKLASPVAADSRAVLEANLEPIRPAAALANVVPLQPAVTEPAPPEVAMLELATVNTSIGDLEVQLEPAEDVHAMTQQSEALMLQQSESNASAEEPKTVSTASDVQTHLEMVGQFQEGVPGPEGVITPELEPVSLRNAVAPEAVLQEQALLPEAQPIRLVSLTAGAIPPRRGFALYRILLQRLSRQYKLLWRMAPIVAMLSVVFLLLAASAHRFSPIPAGLTRDSGQSRGAIPFADPQPSTQGKTKSFASTVQAASTPRPEATKPLVPTPGHSISGQVQAGGSQVDLASSRQRVIRPKPRDRVSKSDADYVAKDTVVRYNSRSTSPSAPHKK